MSKIKEELHSLNPIQLKDKINELRREYFSMQLNSATAHIKDYSQFRKLRKNIARALTYLKQSVSSNS